MFPVCRYSRGDYLIGTYIRQYRIRWKLGGDCLLHPFCISGLVSSVLHLLDIDRGLRTGFTGPLLGKRMHREGSKPQQVRMLYTISPLAVLVLSFLLSVQGSMPPTEY